MMPFRPGEQMDNLMASVNGPQGYPDFHWVNPAGVDAFLANGPMSSNVEDRRGPDYTYNEAAGRPGPAPRGQRPITLGANPPTQRTTQWLPS